MEEIKEKLTKLTNNPKPIFEFMVEDLKNHETGLCASFDEYLFILPVKENTEVFSFCDEFDKK